MSAGDLWVKEVASRYGLILIGLLLSAFLVTSRWTKFREGFFRAHLVGFEAECSDLAASHKRRLFKALHDIVSKDDTLRTLGRIRILEIGIKTGENIQFYPDGSHLVGVDWNRKLREYLVNSDHSWRFQHVLLERLVIGDGSSLRGVASGSIDAVITTRSLCSAHSPVSALGEIRRVLVPGGKYFFMEHVADRRGSFTQWMQMLLSRTGIWPSVFDGCRLDADPVRDIETAGFKEVQWRPITLEGYVSRPHHLALTRHHIIGTAIR